jgi:hypothetical protein
MILVSKEQWDEYVKDTRLHTLGKCWCGNYHKNIKYRFPNRVKKNS